MYITVTSLRLKRFWHFFKLAYFALHVTKQMKGEKGFVHFKNKGLGMLQHTLSAWESEEDLRRFARSGAHAESMRKSHTIAAEIRTLTYQSDTIPDWKEAEVLLMEKGKLITFK